MLRSSRPSHHSMFPANIISVSITIPSSLQCKKHKSTFFNTQVLDVAVIAICKACRPRGRGDRLVLLSFLRPKAHLQDR
jgi:hypothetical protein